MDLARLYAELVLAAERAGIEVRAERFASQLSDVRDPGGGLCTLRGRRLILVDAALPLPERVVTVASALAEVDLEHLYLPPVVRATIGAYQGAARRPPKAPAPAARRPPARARRR
ncbi:MAG TPA: hypothetical protein VHB21_03795 [Minicystis sp.]|nr:hypothetical protein [Minicystis sp.]